MKRSFVSTVTSACRQVRERSVAYECLEIRDRDLVRELIRDRQRRGIDKYDEVWDGVYVMPPLANNPHQQLVGLLTPVYHEVVQVPGHGQVFPGANVSDRRTNWRRNYRCPDIVVVLNNSRAIDCGTHWYGRPDFLTEIQSPGDETEEKIPFYGRIHVRELLIVQRDTRELRLLRHDGHQLVETEPSIFQGKRYLVSEVVPLAFRRLTHKGRAATEVCRTDGTPGRWIV